MATMATTSGLIVPLILVLFFLQIVAQFGLSSALPIVISSAPAVDQMSSSTGNKDLEESSNEISASNGDKLEFISPASGPLVPSTLVTQKSIPVKVSNVDKLKRGLASFVSQQNPAPFFIPPAPMLQQQAKASGSGTQTMASSNLVTGDGSAEAIIKGQNRLIHARPIGGALRWGR